MGKLLRKYLGKKNLDIGHRGTKLPHPSKRTQQERMYTAVGQHRNHHARKWDGTGLSR